MSCFVCLAEITVCVPTENMKVTIRWNSVNMFQEMSEDDKRRVCDIL